MIAFITELPIMLWWYSVIVGIGLIFIPLSSVFFNPLPDRGYALSKILGIALISYGVWVLSSLHIMPFGLSSIVLMLVVSLAGNWYIWNRFGKQVHIEMRTALIEEGLFLIGLLFLIFIRGHEASIHGLEKYMDFGFINAILNTAYFPPQDMWLAPEIDPQAYTGGFSINYYYFGHYVTALLTKLSGIGSNITYNFMLATIFGLTLSGMFSIGHNLFKLAYQKASTAWTIAAGVLSALIVSIGGNLHTIYLFTSGYENEHPVPFWQILRLLPDSTSGVITLNYWYPNATRFIPNTIHEFPSYSWVVADLHGHVLDIPFVLLTVSTILTLLLAGFNKLPTTRRTIYAAFLGLMCGIMYMTNAWDGLIYLGASLIALLIVSTIRYGKKNTVVFKQIVRQSTGITIGTLIASFIIFNMPFNLSFVPFVHGIGIVGGYEIAHALGIARALPAQELTSGGINSDVRLLGPLLLEKGNNLRSPMWMLSVLWGFFGLCVYLTLNRFSRSSGVRNQKFWLAPGVPISIQKALLLSACLVGISVFIEALMIPRLSASMEPSHINDPLALIFGTSALLLLIAAAIYLAYHYLARSAERIFILLLIIVAAGLIMVPEIIYAKDIYPGHYRANTMFKLGYQAFILLSAVSGYAIVSFCRHVAQIKKTDSRKTFLKGAVLALIALVCLVLSYSYYALSSFYGAFKPAQTGGRTYETIDGTAWLQSRYPGDYAAVTWLNNNLTASDKQNAVLLEAVGDSYTDYGRMSVHTGIPTILGWPVHEWLWRGSYDEPGTRLDEVKRIYEGTDEQVVRSLLDQFNVTYIVIGQLERDKYPSLNEELITSLGEKVFESGNTALYKR